ncbi:MAG: (Fe-S)-binding protein [Bryobacteraceae bacterium]
MPDPALETILGAPGYALLLMLTVVSIGLFARRVAHFVRVLRRARPERRLDRVPERLKLFAVHVLGQRRLFGEPVIGAAHFLIFWAFVFYAGSFFWNLVRGLFPFLPVPYSDEVWAAAFAVEVMGALGLLALLAAAVRRYAFTPPRLERSRDATVILTLIALVLLTSLAGAGFAAMEKPGAPPIGALIGKGLAAAGLREAARGYLWMWWLHMATVLGFLAYLPYSKHLHLLASPFGVLFADLDPARIPVSSPGAAKLEEFTWRQLFSGLACAECGRCDRACPAQTSGAGLSPKELMHELKQLVAAGNGRSVDSAHVWACASCGACVERCPVFNEQLPVIIELRRRLVAEGAVDARLQAALVNLSRYGNSFGQSARSRAKWAQGLGFPIKDARKEAVEYLWITGDYAALHPRVQPVTAAAARVLHRAGVSFGILYEAEQNSGNDARRAGEEGLFEVLREKNLAALSRARFDRILTTDPHSYHALKHEYGRNDSVVHISELLARLFAAGKLPVNTLQRVTAAYQDPCYLGRYNGVYQPPRDVLGAVGVKLVEMPRHGAEASCCGAGGGRIWMEDAPGVTERPAERRVREAAALGPVRVLAVSCPKDLVMFEDAIKTAALDATLQVRDVVQLVEEATRPSSQSAGAGV